MSIRRVVWPIAASMLLLMAGCAKDEGPVLIPRQPVPAGQVDTAYFSTEVATIFHAKCWLCHPPYGGMDLSPGEVYINLVMVTSTNYAPAMRVVPGDVDASVLWHKVTGDGVYGTMMPPPGYAQLTLEELQTIRDWIEQGALDN